MVAQFSSENYESNSIVDSRLIPQINFSVSIQDSISSDLDSVHTWHARIARVEIKATSIEKSLIIGSITRIFEHVYNAIVIDISPDILADPRFEPVTNKYAPPTSIEASITVNKTSNIPTVNFNLIVENLKFECVDDVLSRTKTYFLNAISADMNPN